MNRYQKSLFMILRFLVFIAIAVWFGGFTFYSTAVISTAQEVLHSHLRAGLITQQVTNWLNLISIVPLALCLLNLATLRKANRKGQVRVLATAMATMILLQAVLFGIHPLLDAQIVAHDVPDGATFFKLHRLYLVVSTAQWLATLCYVWTTLKLWTARYDSGMADQACFAEEDLSASSSSQRA
jgi:hypothetical protein